jgi:hypothetical protein
MVLSKFESVKSSTMKSQSRIRTNLEAKSTIRAKILDKSAIRCINKIRENIRQIRNPNNFFCEIRRSENLFTHLIELSKQLLKNLLFCFILHEFTRCSFKLLILFLKPVLTFPYMSYMRHTRDAFASVVRIRVKIRLRMRVLKDELELG